MEEACKYCGKEPSQLEYIGNFCCFYRRMEVRRMEIGYQSAASSSQLTPSPEPKPMPTETTKPFGVYVKTFAEASHGVDQKSTSGCSVMGIDRIDGNRITFQSKEVFPNSRDHLTYESRIRTDRNGQQYAVVRIGDTPMFNPHKKTLRPLKDDNTPAIAPKAQKPPGRSFGAKVVSGIGILIKIATMSLLGVGVGKLYRDVDALRQYVYRSGHEINRIQTEMADLKPPLMTKPNP